MPEKEKPPYQSTLERFPDHVRTIGMITIEMANLEIFLGEMLGAMLHIDPHVGQILLLTPRGAIGRVDVLQNVAANVLKENSVGLRNIESINKRARNIINKRNNMIHKAWGVDSGAVQKISMPLSVPDDREAVWLEDLTKLLLDIRNLIVDVFNATQDMMASYQPTP